MADTEPASKGKAVVGLLKKAKELKDIIDEKKQEVTRAALNSIVDKMPERAGGPIRKVREAGRRFHNRMENPRGPIEKVVAQLYDKRDIVVPIAGALGVKAAIIWFLGHVVIPVILFVMFTYWILWRHGYVGSPKQMLAKRKKVA